jgi:hypothetical protein
MSANLPKSPRKHLPKCIQPDDKQWTAPLDASDLAVRLEMEGVTDGVARSDHGFDDAWQMAQALLRTLPPAERGKNTPPEPVTAWREYSKGAAFALPIALSGISMLLFRLSLWGGDLSSGEATAIGIATIISFIVTGGYVYSMSRRGLFYRNTGQPSRCADATWSSIGSAVRSLAVVAAAALAANAWFRWFPGPLIAVAVAFMLALGLLWLSTAVLYMLEQSLFVSICLVTGIGEVVLLRMCHVGLFAAQLSGILTAAFLAFGYSVWSLERKRVAKADCSLGSPARNLYDLAPDFTYGCLYYFFLFGDRLLAWTAHTGPDALIVQFRGDYELALDASLLAFILLSGWVQYSIRHFYYFAQSAEIKVRSQDAALFNRAAGAFYIKKILRFLPVAAATAAAVFYGSGWLAGLGGKEMRTVVACDVAGLALLIIGLWGAGLLFSLSRSADALKSIALATLANIAAGYVASRLGPYNYAVFGFLFGAFVFALSSTWHCLRMVRRLDYFYFAASS